MVKVRACLISMLCAAWATNAFAAGSLYVLQMGNGSGALSSAAAPVLIKKLDASTYSLQSTISMPIADSGNQHSLTVSGSSTTEGHLALSTDGNYLTLGGYDAVPGTATIGETDSTLVNRVIGRVTLSSGAIDTSTALTDAYSGIAANAAGFRSVVSSNGTDFWTAGTRGFGAPSGSDGTRYASLGATTSTSVANFPNGPSNTRVVGIFNGQLYTSSGSATTLGINAVGTGLPTTSGQTATLTVPTAVSGVGNASPYDFWFKDTNNVYVADDRSVTNGGGIQKWTFDGSNWNLAYTLIAGASSGARGLTGEFDGTNTVLWATNTGGQLVTITDTGASSLFSVKAVSPSNTTYRGIVFVPGPTGVLGDYNGDGKVNAADYVLWKNGGPLLNESASPGTVDLADYTYWKSRFGATSGSGAGFGAAAVPEPAAGLLMIFGCGIFVGRRRAA